MRTPVAPRSSGHGASTLLQGSNHHVGPQTMVARWTLRGCGAAKFLAQDVTQITWPTNPNLYVCMYVCILYIYTYMVSAPPRWAYIYICVCVYVCTQKKFAHVIDGLKTQQSWLDLDQLIPKNNRLGQLLTRRPFEAGIKLTTVGKEWKICSKNTRTPKEESFPKKSWSRNYWRSILPIPYAPPHLYTFPGPKNRRFVGLQGTWEVPAPGDYRVASQPSPTYLGILRIRSVPLPML